MAGRQNKVALTQGWGMVDPTADQMEALASGEAVPVQVAGTPCVLLRGDICEHRKVVLDVETAYPLIDESFREGWEAPGMEDCDRYEQLRKP